MQLLTLNAAGKQLAPPAEIHKRRRRLTQVIGRHVDRTRPHMIAVQNARDPLQPIDEAWITRGWKVPPVKDSAGVTVKEGIVKPWPRRYLRADDIVVVVYLPRGGSSGGSSGRKSPLKIALSIAAIALVAFSGPIGGAIAGALSITSTFGIAAVTAGVVVAGSALMGLASKSKANKANTDDRKVYGINGGGNLPRPGDRIPRGYGRHWMKPDLSQPDFNQYDGDDMILTKRHTLGCGRYHVRALRAGKQDIWREGVGFIAPFNDARNKIEFIYGTPSEIAPSNVIAAGGVGGELPRLEDNPQYAGPYLINPRGALVNRLQVDFQFPNGISRVDYYKSGSSKSGLPGEWGVQFEYAPIDEGGNLLLGWQVLYSGNSGNEGSRFATQPLRYTKFKDVPPGRYAVRGVNVAKDTSERQEQNSHQNMATWDGASGWVGDTVVRPGVTEICARIYATKATGNAAFSELEADAAAIIPVYRDGAWVEEETSKAVWAFCDIMRNQDYGGALPDNQVDRTVPSFYASALTKFDTFDGTIRGPVSVFDAAGTVLLPMRAEPVHMGRFWSIVRDDTKAVRRHMITRRQMVKGSTRITFDLDVQAGAAHVIGEYDRDGDYRNPSQTACVVGEASITPTRVNWQGVKTHEHATHLTRWKAGIGAYRRQTIPFGVTLESKLYKRGDAISVDPWFIDGHSTAGVLDLDGAVVLTDWAVPLKAGDYAAFRDRRGREWGPVLIDGTAGSPELIRLNAASVAQVVADTGITLAALMDNGRGDMTTMRVGALVVLRENYLVQTLQYSGPRKANVTAVIDDPRVWELIGQEIVNPPIGEGGLAPVEVPRVVGLSANAVQMAAGLRCDYAIVPGRGAERFEFGISYDGVRFETIQDAQITGSVMLNPVDPMTVTVRARAFGYSGLPGPYFTTPLALGKSTILGALLDDFSVELSALSAETQKQLQDISDLGKGVLAEGSDRTTLALQTANDTIRGAIRQIAEAIDRAEAEAATQAVNAYEAREFIKIASGRNFASIERVDRARISDREAFAESVLTITTKLTTIDGQFIAVGGAIQGLSSRITEVNGVVTSVQQDVTTLYGRVNAADGAIAGEATARQLLETRVSANEDNFSAVSMSVIALRSELLGRIGEESLAQSTATDILRAETTRINGEVVAAGERTTALETTVNNPQTGVSATSRALDTLTSRTSSIEGRETTTAEKLLALDSTIRDADGKAVAAAGLASQALTSAGLADGKATATAQTVQSLQTTVDGNTATITNLSGSYDGIRAQYGVTIDLDGQTGGYILTGAKSLDGSVSFAFKIRGDLFVDGTITGRSLAVRDLIVQTAQIGDLVVATRSIGNRQVTNYAAGVGSGKTVDVMMNVREGSFVFIIGYAVNGPQTEFPRDILGGQIQIQYDDTTVINALPNNFVSTGTGDSRRSRILTSHILGFATPPSGNRKFTLINTTPVDAPGVVLFVMEFAR